MVSRGSGGGGGGGSTAGVQHQPKHRRLCCTECRAFRCLFKTRRESRDSNYVRMEAEEEDYEPQVVKKPEKENAGKSSKKSKKAWKRIRRAALMTCRYIGMGAAHMSPATLYVPSQYYVDPKDWNKSYSSTAHKAKPQPQAPHWTNTFMFAAW